MTLSDSSVVTGELHPHTQKTMLITGANGFIGSRLATLAMTRGYRVQTLTRRDWDAVPPVPVAHRYLGSLPGRIPGEALRGVDTVVHCAADLGAREQSAHAVNVEGTLRLAQLASRAGVKTFIFVSSQSAGPDALSVYGRTKYAAEQALLDLRALNIIILRPGLVTGPGSRGLFRRMCRIVERLPVIPLLGGNRAIVQPIHLDDLCEAVFRCDEGASELNGRVLRLGSPQGLPLAEFLQALALARWGKRKPAFTVPVWPLEMALRAAEALGIPLPINSNNLKGARTVRRMDTESDLADLKLRLRPLEDTIRADGNTSEAAVSLQERAVRVLLIGGGRIGLAHSVTLSRLGGLVLCGVVEPRPSARGLLQGMGLSMPMFDSLEQALQETRPDAAVIATPVASHLSIARECLSRGLAVMVEKPLAIGAEQLADFERLAQAFPECPVQVGYVMPRNPQVSVCLERLRAGEFGQVQGFLGLTLLSFIQEEQTGRWEVKKEVSGGGALINAGGHVLSMIQAAFGNPQDVGAQSLRLYSAEVEDSMVLTFSYPGFSGRHYCSWSINGYPRQENKLVIWTDRGKLILTGSVGVFLRHDGEMELVHQLDFDVGFNLAPDYAGAGFSTELTDLRDSTRSRRPAPMNLEEAVKLERLLFRAYAVSREVQQFSDSELQANSQAPADLKFGQRMHDCRPPTDLRRALDLRDLSIAQSTACLQAGPAGDKWDEYLLNPDQARQLPSSWQRSDRIRITVPDFLAQSRLLAAGRSVQVMKQMGLGGVLLAARAAMPLLAGERGPTFWVAAMGLLGAALHAVPGRFRGTLLLHGYLTDFALSLNRVDILDRMLAICRRLHPDARVGFHTNMAEEAANVLWLLETATDEVSLLTAPQARGMREIVEAMHKAGKHRSLRLTAEVGLAPDVVHRAASRFPGCWAFGADCVLVGAGADPALAEFRRREAAEEWTRAFPGAAFPEEAL